MERKKIYMYGAILLVALLILIMLSNPFTQEILTTNDYLSEDGLWEFGEPIRINATNVNNDQSRPIIWDSLVLYNEKQRFVIPFDREVWVYNMTDNSYTSIANKSGVDELVGDIYQNYVTWYDDRNSVYDVHYMDLDDGVDKPVHWFGTRDDYGFPSIWGDIIAYQDPNDDLWYFDISANSSTKFHDCILFEYGQYPQIYDNIIVYEVYNYSAGGVYELWMYDIDADEETQLVWGVDCRMPQIWDDKIVYHTFREGVWTLEYYDLNEGRYYTIITDDEWNSNFMARYPDIYEDLIIYVDESEGIGIDTQMAMLDLSFSELFGEYDFHLTNDTVAYDGGSIHDGVIAYYGRTMDTFSDDLWVQTYQPTGADIYQEFESETVYNTNWIFLTIIIGLTLLAFSIAYLVDPEGGGGYYAFWK